MSEQPTAVLRVEPHTIPRLRVAYTDALESVRVLLREMQDFAFIPEPWMGDPVSLDVWNHYNSRFAEGDQSPYAQLVLYERELRRVVEALTQMEAEYRRTEGDNAALWGRMV